MAKKVLRELYEIHKPSVLCQTIFYASGEDKQLLYLPAIQIDLINTLIYLTWKQINTSGKTIVLGDDSIKKYEIDLKDITTMIGKYQNDYKPIIKLLKELQGYRVELNVLDKDSKFEKASTLLVNKVKWVEEKGHVRKTAKVWLDSEILNLFVREHQVFAKIYLKIQFSFVSKYSKLLYEILKDYEAYGNTISFENLILLLNVDTDGTKNAEWSSFRPHILEKAVKEINNKSDIKVSYKPIKERPTENSRLQVTKVRFDVEKQSPSKLKELGFIQDSIKSNDFYLKSKNKLDKLVKNGYTVIDEDKWVEADIEKNKDKYIAENRIDTWLSSHDNDIKNELFENLANTIDECDDPTVFIDNYIIKGMFTEENFTVSAQETIELLNKIIESMD